ncbi:hypothetical protein H0H93_009941 [Arthromyces matolae]|nr:hypothetical protein H0H93_009941 [Arthromyces matolae]
MKITSVSFITAFFVTFFLLLSASQSAAAPIPPSILALRRNPPPPPKIVARDFDDDPCTLLDQATEASQFAEDEYAEGFDDAGDIQATKAISYFEEYALAIPVTQDNATMVADPGLDYLRVVAELHSDRDTVIDQAKVAVGETFGKMPLPCGMQYIITKLGVEAAGVLGLSD